jgi:hypothetical protein
MGTMPVIAAVLADGQQRDAAPHYESNYQGRGGTHPYHQTDATLFSG